MNKAFSEMELEAGEQILWQGKPQQRVSTSQWWKIYLGALVTGGLLVWSFTGVELALWPGLCAFQAEPFSRLVLAALTLGMCVIPSLAAYSTNGSEYLITNRRIAISKPGIKGGSYVDSRCYAEMESVRVSPLQAGLASLRFTYQNETNKKMVQELVYAIPRLVAEDVEKLVAQAKS